MTDPTQPTDPNQPSQPDQPQPDQPDQAKKDEVFGKKREEWEDKAVDPRRAAEDEDKPDDQQDQA